jgi:hypothetical protein
MGMVREFWAMSTSIEPNFQEAAEGMNHVCYHSLSPFSAKSFFLNPFHRIVLEVGLLN